MELEFEMLEYGDKVELVNGDICVYIRKYLSNDKGCISQELNLVNIFTGKEINIHQYNDDLTHDRNPMLNVKRFVN